MNEKDIISEYMRKIGSKTSDIKKQKALENLKKANLKKYENKQSRNGNPPNTPDNIL